MLYSISKAFWFFGAPSRILEFLTIAIFCWAMAGSRGAYIMAAATAALLLFVGVVPVGAWLLMPLEGRFPEWRQTSPRPFDGIIALGGDTGHRVAELGRLSRLFPTAQLVYTGRRDRQAAELEIRQIGLDPSHVTIESESRSTFENAAYTAQIVRPKAAERWLLITSAAHMPRAIGCFRRSGFQVTADPVDFHTDSTSYIYATTAPQRVVQLDDAAKEWLGLIAYRIAGGTTALFPAP